MLGLSSRPAIIHSRRAPSPGSDLLLLLAAFVAIYLLPAGLRPLVNPDEGRYVEMAREMAVTGDYISPRLNGVLYFEKPPLFYWLEAGAIKIGGLNLWVLRFWPIALAFIAAAAVYGTGRALWGRAAGLWSAAVLSTCLLFYGLAQIIILDMAVSVFLTLSVCAFLLAVRAPPGKTRRHWCWALYVAMVGALMTKGLIGLVIPGAIFFLWLLLLNKWRELRHAHIFSGVVILLVLGLPWHIAAAMANPPPGGWNWSHFFTKDWNQQGFVWYYIWHEHVLRFTDPETAHHVQGWWFFPAVLVGGFLPWAFFLPQAVLDSLRGGWGRLKNEPAIPLLFIWTLFPLLFFSISASKLIPYILPSVPPLALLTGRFLARAYETPGAPALKWPLRLLAGLLLAAAVTLPFLPHYLGDKIPAAATPWFGGLAFLFLLCGLASLLSTLRIRGHGRPDLTVLLGCTAVFLMAVNPIVATFLADRRPSAAPAAEWLRPRLHDTDQVFTLWDFGPYQDFVPFLGRTIGIAGVVPQEQEFGLMLETAQVAPRYPGIAEYLKYQHPLSPPGAPPAPMPSDPLMPAFLEHLRGPARVYVLVAASQFPDFQKRYPDVPAHELWHDDHFVIFSNQPDPA